MPAGKSSESNATLYAMIVFITLFLIALVAAILYYNKAENYRIQGENTESTLKDIASIKERNNLSKIVGNRLKGKTYIGTLQIYLEELYSAITGQIPEDTSAEAQIQNFRAKVTDVKMQINETQEFLEEDATAIWGPQDVDLLQTITVLKRNLDIARESAQKMETLCGQIQQDYDDDKTSWRDEEALLNNQKSEINRSADILHARFDELREMMNKSTEQQVQTCLEKLNTANDKLEQKNMDVLRLQAELAKTDESLQFAIKSLEEIKPNPDAQLAAFKPDASIVTVEGNVAYIDIGSKDHVYTGLTFSVYDRNVPIPEDGKGKAEIEVFQVSENASAARVLTASKKNAIIPSDIVANLIWDADVNNTFVVSGEFDFDGDGKADFDGKEKVLQLIERWGGRVTDDIDIRTDFIVLGFEPEYVNRPSEEQIDADPRILQKYENYERDSQQYFDILDQARTFSIPVYSQRKFMNLIGYKTTAEKSKPF
jgi:hypothetical protein